MQRPHLRLWRFPVLLRGIVRETKTEGFNIAIHKHWGKFQMERHARKLLPPCPVDASTQPVGEVHFLTGCGHGYQTAFAAYSLQLFCGAPVHIVIHDDGSLNEETMAYLHRALPLLTIRSTHQNEERVADYLPRSQFPALWAARSKFVLMRKLMDVHASEPGWKMLLDSDMIFWREPRALITWLQKPDRPCCMEDSMVSYGYTDEALATCLGGQAPDGFINTGMCGLNREAIDWGRLNSWCAYLANTFGINHFLEQALTALLLTGTPYFKFPRRDYITFPMREQMLPIPEGVLHHYVADSRKFLYIYAWRYILDRLDELTSGEKYQAPSR